VHRPGDSGDVVKSALPGCSTGPLKKLVLAAFLLLLPAALSSAEEFERRVTWVVDGDSFKFRVRVLDVTVEDECRMLGYNAPKMTGGERRLGRRAKGRLIELIAGETVRISTEKRDRYGRNLCDVWLRDGTHVNRAMKKWLEDEGYEDVHKYQQMER
jgi:endonuclease YncB( thermonuclease family)